jgi:hypothetical protein
MQKYEAIERGILENDLEALRESVGSICYTCRNFKNGEFDEVVEYVISRGIPLIDPELKGELVSSGKESFTDGDFARAVFELKENFCNERIADVKTIGAALYPNDHEVAEDGNADGADHPDATDANGDAEEAEESYVLTHNDPALLDCDILKVAHHGSSTSTSEDFLNAVSPNTCVISCGRGNSYGHPSNETVTRIRDYGADIRRTDTEGNIRIHVVTK